MSALKEVGNILAGSYLTSLSAFTGLTFVPMVPAMAVDMAGAVLDYVLAEFGQVADQVLLIETEFLALGRDIYSYFFLVPKPDALKAIFAALGWALSEGNTPGGNGGLGGGLFTHEIGYHRIGLLCWGGSL